MQSSSYSVGDLIIKEKQKIDSILIIERGVCQVVTKFEGNEFVLEELNEGAIINYRSYLREDLMFVNM